MKIRVTIGEDASSATIFDSVAARDFVSMLPLTLTLRDFSGSEKISNLPRELSTEGSPAGADPEIGDIAYYAPWGNLAIYYADSPYAEGVVKLGRLDSGVESLARMSEDFSVTIERQEGV